MSDPGRLGYHPVVTLLPFSTLAIEYWQQQHEKRQWERSDIFIVSNSGRSLQPDRQSPPTILSMTGRSPCQSERSKMQRELSLGVPIAYFWTKRASVFSTIDNACYRSFAPSCFSIVHCLYLPNCDKLTQASRYNFLQSSYRFAFKLVVLFRAFNPKDSSSSSTL